MKQNKNTRVAISRGYLMEQAARYAFDNALDSTEDVVKVSYFDGYVKGVEAVVNPLGLEVVVVD